MTGAVSKRIGSLQGTVLPLLQFVTSSSYAGRIGENDIADFVFGNPHEMALPEFADALKKASEPQDKNWFAYKRSEPEATSVVAKTLREIHGLPFEDHHIFMTNGAFAALTVALSAICDPGDEVIFFSPPWFFYEALIVDKGATPVRVRVDANTFDLDLAAVEAALTERTRAIIVNSPNNPTGKIYPDSTLRALGEMLTEASKKNGRPIYLLSDEAYSRIVFDDKQFVSPALYYDNSFLIYTYAKTLLTPGQRIGYIAISPAIQNLADITGALFMAQTLTGWAFPNALLQHALANIEGLSIDIGRLEARRDKMVGALRSYGYDVHSPEGTFYLLPRSPIPDDVAFTERLATLGVFVLPGTVVEMPGYFRISLTANDEMVERGLEGFRDAIGPRYRQGSEKPAHSMSVE